MNSRLRKRLIQLIVIVEATFLVLALVLTTIYHAEKIKNKSLLFLDAARNDFLQDDQRALQQKIQIAISGHEFKRIVFYKERSSSNEENISLLDKTISAPILANTEDANSEVGVAQFVFSLQPGIIEGLLLWAVSSIGFLITLPFLKKIFTNQIRTELETEMLRELANMATKVAHDIRSPLSAIHMMTSIPDLNTNDARDLLKSAATRINSIAQDLVDSARKDIDLVESVHIEKLLTSIAKEKSFEFADKKNIKIQLNINEDTVVLGHEQDLKRTISNLINNAIEAKDKQEIIIDITVKTSGLISQIALRDNGCGISPDLMKDLGKRRIKSSKYGVSGSGIGVLQARESIEKMGGKLLISSQTGIGSTFTIELPILTSA